MKNFTYLIEFIVITIFFLIFRIIGYKAATNFGFFIGKVFGPLFRSKKKIIDNIKNYKSSLRKNEIDEIIKKMWGNYGRILAEYPYISSFRNKKLEKYIEIKGRENLEKIKKNGKPVVFISGHFNNFELMAMVIEREGIELGAVYRPLNNKFLNVIMEYLRKKYICKNQIKKGLRGVKEALSYFKNGKSLAIMIDQRVSEGIKSKFFGKDAFTTTIPAQFVKKFDCIIQPVHIERINDCYFKILFDSQFHFNENQDEKYITERLNFWLEEKITINPDQWIWTHDRWKN
tara:strand:- start:920 stop:1783 length:864 start_codon:yes stop_codon:yes gene_type:complete